MAVSLLFFLSIFFLVVVAYSLASEVVAVLIRYGPNEHRHRIRNQIPIQCRLPGCRILLRIRHLLQHRRHLISSTQLVSFLPFPTGLHQQLLLEEWERVPRPEVWTGKVTVYGPVRMSVSVPS